MKLSFRQGLVGFQTSAAVQQFLIQSTTSGFIDLIVSPTPTVFTFAHGSSNYLLKIDSSIPQAWGPVIPGVDNYLYWDINLISGVVTRGITTLAPVVGPTTPANPVEGQLWFDTSRNKMYVKRAGDKPFIECVRGFAGMSSMGSTTAIQLYNFLGAGISQVGLNVESEHGFILLDELGVPLKNSSGEFLTSTSAVRVRSGTNAAGVLTSPVNNLVQVVAAEPIPEFSVVYFTGLDSIRIARQTPSSSPVPVGIVIHNLGLGETGTMVQFGEITSDEWSWVDADAGRPLYINGSGQITTTRPGNTIVHRVGFVKGAKSILFSIDSEAEVQIVAVPGTIINGVAPITAVTALNPDDEIVSTISMVSASPLRDGYMTADQVVTLNAFDSRITMSEGDIETLTTNKAPVIHGHPIADIVALQDALDEKALATHHHDSQYSAATHHHDSQYSALGHGHLISDVTNLQTALNGKAASTHSHTISDVLGLQDDLDTRALQNHTHGISNVTGLESVLDSKISFTNTTEFTPTTSFHPATKAYVDSRSIDALTDVDTSTNAPALGDALKWNGTSWVPGTDATSSSTALDALTDVQISTTPDNLAVLTYSTSLSQWVPIVPQVQSLSTLTDVAITSAANNQALVFDSVTSSWRNQSLSEMIDDRVASLLVAGTNIALSYDDTANTLTIESTAAGAGPTALNDLTDVNLVGPIQDRATLSWNTTSNQWVTNNTGLSVTFPDAVIGSTPATITAVDRVREINFVSSVPDHAFGQNGSSGSVTISIPSVLGELYDVNVGSPANGEVLTWSSSNGEWRATAPVSSTTVTNVWRFIRNGMSFNGVLTTGWSTISRRDQETSPTVDWNGPSEFLSLLEAGLWEVEVIGRITCGAASTFPEGLSSYGVRLDASAGAQIRTETELVFTRYTNPSATSDPTTSGNSSLAGAVHDGGRIASFSGKFMVATPMNGRITPAVFSYNHLAPTSESSMTMTLILRRVGPFELS